MFLGSIKFDRTATSSRGMRLRRTTGLSIRFHRFSLVPRFLADELLFQQATETYFSASYGYSEIFNLEL